MTIEVENFLQENNTILEVRNIADFYKDLDILINHRCKLTSLTFSQLDLTAEHVEHLNYAIWNNKTLTHLDFSGCMLGDHKIAILFQAFNNHKTLNVLDLSANNITSQSAEQLAHLIRVKSRLTELNLDGNDIDDDGAQELLRILYYHRQLQPIDICLNNNDDLDEDLKKSIDDMVKKIKDNAELEQEKLKQERITKREQQFAKGHPLTRSRLFPGRAMVSILSNCVGQNNNTAENLLAGVKFSYGFTETKNKENNIAAVKPKRLKNMKLPRP